MIEEIWKNIDGYNGDYQVSSLGRVKSFKQNKIDGKILKFKKNNGYFEIRLYKNNKPKYKKIHNLLFEAFNDYKLKENECIHHIDGNKFNNDLKNLKLMNISEHRHIHMKNENNPCFGKHKDHPMYGKHHSEKSKKEISENHSDQRGENNPTSKLNNEEVWLIKKILNSDLYKSKKISQEFIGKMFGVGRVAITNIKSGKTWSHIKYE